MPRSDLEAGAPVVIRIRTVPALAGLAWIRAGFRLFARRPGGFLGLSAIAMIMAPLVLFAVPAILEPLSLALIPLGSLGFMVASQAVLDDLPALPGAFVEPLRRGPAQRWALLQIGTLYVVTALAAYVVGNWIDGGEAMRWVAKMARPGPGGEPPAAEPISRAGVFSLLLQAGWLAFVSVPLWHAPALVHWGRQRAPQAMFSSIVALWRTRWAFVLYTLGWWVLGVFAMVATSLITAFAGSPMIAVMMLIAAMWPLSTVFYVSFWYVFADTFEIRPAAVDSAIEPGRA